MQLSSNFLHRLLIMTISSKDKPGIETWEYVLQTRNIVPLLTLHLNVTYKGIIVTWLFLHNLRGNVGPIGIVIMRMM